MTKTAAQKEPIRIGLLEHCGTGNLGDEATVAAVLQNIRVRLPHAAVIGLSLDPSDSKTRHGIPAFAIRQSVFHCEQEWSTGSQKPRGAGFKSKLSEMLSEHRFILGLMRAVYQYGVVKPGKFFREILFLITSLFVVADLDCLIICGGGQLLDRGGPWAFPYTLFKWVLLAKISGAKCLFLNLGAGPLAHPLSRWLVKRSLLLADYVSFRDSKSRALIREIGYGGKAMVAADCVYALELPRLAVKASRLGARNELTIGVAPTAYRDPSRYWERNRSDYEVFIRKLAEFCARLVSKGHRLRLFSSDIWFDSQAIADLRAAINKQCGLDNTDLVTTEPVNGVDEFLMQLSQVDYFVTCKYHGVIFAHRLNVPVLAVAHHMKVSTLMEECGLAQYSLDIADFDADNLAAAFDLLTANADEVRERMQRKVVLYQAELNDQFDCLFSQHKLLAGEGAPARSN